MGVVERVTAAVTAFLDGLEPRQRPLAGLPFDETARRTWTYLPGPRSGIPMWALSRAQTKTAFQVLAAMLAPAAFARAVAVMGLEEVLDQLEGARGDGRHSRDYWLAVFGTPGMQPWGVRLEGHHLSVHATVAAAEIRLLPLFLGANPACTWDGDHVVVAPLRVEERLGFELLKSLSTEQRSAAVFADDAPADIVTRNRPRLDGPLEPVGVPLAALDGAAAATAAELVRVYLARFPAGTPLPPPDDVCFGWAGATEPGVGHYYRLAGRRFLVELDNTQNGANHVHTVVRDPESDFGADLLVAHYERSHIMQTERVEPRTSG